MWTPEDTALPLFAPKSLENNFKVLYTDYDNFMVLYHCVGDFKPYNVDSVRILSRQIHPSFGLKHKLRRMWHKILPDMDEHSGYGSMRYHGYHFDMVKTSHHKSCKYFSDA
jgi:hypothetical protein